MGLYRVGSPLSVSVDDFPALSPLPVGAATLTMQNVQNATLNNMLGKLLNVDTTQVTFASSQGVIVEEDASMTHTLLFQILQKLEDIYLATLKQGV